MIGVCCLANICRVHSLFLDQLIVLMKPEQGTKMAIGFLGRFMLGLIVAIFGVFSCLFKSFGEFIN